MNESVPCSFRLASPYYKRMLDYLSKDQNISPSVLLNKLIRDAANDALNFYASKAAHERHALKSGIPIEHVSWILGDTISHWQRLAQNIGEEKARDYMNKFMPTYYETIEKIDREEELGLYDLTRRNELAEIK